MSTRENDDRHVPDVEEFMSGMDEVSIYEALGVTRKDEGAKEQEPAEPVTQETEAPTGEGEKAQEPAEPAPEGAGQEPEEDAGEKAEKAPANEADPQLTPEQRNENAARRRRQEQQAAIEQAVNNAIAQEREKSRSEWTAFFEKANLKNTLTGQPIKTLDEFNTWAADFEAAKLQRDLKAGKLTPEGLEKAISNSPIMQKMKEIAERDEAVKHENEMAAAKVKIEAELQEIHKLDPTISKTEDLLKMPTAKEFYEYVRKGNSFLDAYYLANRDRLTAQTAEAAKQQAMNAARSKEHLQPMGATRGAGASTVPSDEMELFKLLNPNATEAEIQTYYNKSKK